MEKKINEKELNSSLKLLAKSSLFVLIGVILSKIFAYIFRVIVARHFGPEIYGLFSLASMILLLFYSLFSLGLPSGLVRYISIYRARGETNKIKSILKSSRDILLFSSIISSIIFFLTAEAISINIFHNPGLIIYLKFFSLITPFYIFYSFFISVIQAHEEIWWYSFIDNVLQSGSRLLILVILLLIGLGTNSIIFSYTLSIFFIFLVSFYVCRFKFSNLFNKFNIEKKEKDTVARELFSYSWPLTLFALISYFFYWIDSFIIGYFKNASDVGFYNAAVPIAALMIFFPTLFVHLFFPLITKEFGKKNFKMMDEITKQVTKWAFIFNLPLFVIMIFFPGAFLNILFGPEYLVAKNSLIFLSIGSFFSSIFYLSNNIVSVIGKSKLILMNIALVSIFNLILGIILVQRYGISGVAFATMLSNIILSLMLFFEVKYYTSIIPLRRKMISIFFSALVSTIALFYIKQFFSMNIYTMIIETGLFGIIYLLMILLTKSLDKNDFLILRTIKDKISTKKI